MVLQIANKKYDKAFKESIARLSLEEGRTLSSISKEYNITKSTINGWIKRTLETIIVILILDYQIMKICF
ncbi:transposase [Clostridium algidicarnis]|uniref:Transposase n=1 Tax=Clostridium algidicarnis TaxID=37659 RepID=A0ABS6C214_9CLOT|nr:transposase [Clostridium algidicarnis]MBU3219472.1 transposase [Clostridium algidicarnis]